MTQARRVRSRSRRLLLLMLVIIAPPALMLVWLGWRLAESDRALLEKYALEARYAAGQAAVLALDRP